MGVWGYGEKLCLDSGTLAMRVGKESRLEKSGKFIRVRKAFLGMLQ